MTTLLLVVLSIFYVCIWLSRKIIEDKFVANTIGAIAGIFTTAGLAFLILNWILNLIAW